MTQPDHDVHRLRYNGIPIMTEFSDLARRARVCRLIAEALSEQKTRSEHDRLIAVIEGLAEQLGCGQRFDLAQATGYRFDPEPNPDVERIDQAGMVFIGDAKDGENEPASRHESRARIFRYMMALSSLFRSDTATGGYFVLATNSLKAAQDWAEALALAAALCGIVHVEAQTSGFSIWQPDANTWVVW
jgi:hypothetical protein